MQRGRNLKGGSGASTTAVVGVVFVQQWSSEVLMWEGFWLLQINFLYFFVDLHRETSGRFFPPVFMQVFGVKVW